MQRTGWCGRCLSPNKAAERIADKKVANKGIANKVAVAETPLSVLRGRVNCSARKLHGGTPGVGDGPATSNWQRGRPLLGIEAGSFGETPPGSTDLGRPTVLTLTGVPVAVRAVSNRLTQRAVNRKSSPDFLGCGETRL